MLKTDINVGEDIFSLSSLSYMDESNPEFSIEKIKSIIEPILYKRFNNKEKREIENYQNRISFSCPYCGDSATNDTAKRGNLFFNSLGYHCYNCGYHTDLLNMIKNYDIEVSSADIFVLQTYKTISKNSYKINDLLNIDLVSKYGFEKTELFQKFKFIPIGSTKCTNYLLGRGQTNFDNYAYDPENDAIVILNVDHKTNIVLGFQKRLLRKNAKNRYLSYSLGTIYKQLKLEVPEDFEYLDRISMIFNILNIDFNDIITVFEGPFDAFLYKNSVATSGITKDFPFESESIKFWYDNDDAGIKKSKEMINKDNSVFLWTKYLKDLGIPSYKKIKDLTDLIKYTKENNIKLKSFQDYFSTSKIDLFYI